MNEQWVGGATYFDDEVLMHSAQSKQRAHRNEIPARLLVRQHNNAESLVDGVGSCTADLVDCRQHSLRIAVPREHHVNDLGLPTLEADVFDDHHVLLRQDWLLEPESRALLG